MIVPIDFALLEGLGKPEQVLAIVGGAVVGAFVSGLLAQLLCRAMTRKKLPPIPTTVVRVVGGLLFGLLAAMWIWHDGGWGPGNGPGNSNENGNGDATANKDKEPAKPTDKDKPPTPNLRLEVLGGKNDDAVRQAAGGGAAGEQAVTDKRFYRVVGETGEKDLHTLVEMKERIKQRLGEQPALTEVDIVTRPDSPGQSAGRVTELTSVIFDLDAHLKVEYPPQ